MSQIFFTSDTHYNHKNIVRGTSQWKTFEEGSSHQKTRDFDTLEEHNEALVKAINDTVKVDDELWHLGDWSFGGFDSIWQFRKRLHCKKVHLVFGNHDEHIVANKLINLKAEEDKNIWEHYFEFTVRDQPDYGEYRLIQDIFQSVQHYKELSIDGHKLVLCHFAMRVWNKSHKGAIMLFGHSHNTLSPGDYADKRTMDVGVDTRADMKPYSWEEIRKIMNRRPALADVDHHSKNTN
jgi:calcineurin-like phosphoesterase family protein